MYSGISFFLYLFRSSVIHVFLSLCILCVLHGFFLYFIISCVILLFKASFGRSFFLQVVMSVVIDLVLSLVMYVCLSSVIYLCI